MRPSIYWLDLPEAGRLAIMPRPRAGDWLLDEIACWKREAINVVVSLLEQHEVDDLELSEEATCCRAGGRLHAQEAGGRHRSVWGLPPGQYLPDPSIQQGKQSEDRSGHCCVELRGVL